MVTLEASPSRRGASTPSGHRAAGRGHRRAGSASSSSLTQPGSGARSTGASPARRNSGARARSWSSSTCCRSPRHSTSRSAGASACTRSRGMTRPTAYAEPARCGGRGRPRTRSRRTSRGRCRRRRCCARRSSPTSCCRRRTVRRSAPRPARPASRSSRRACATRRAVVRWLQQRGYGGPSARSVSSRPASAGPTARCGRASRICSAPRRSSTACRTCPAGCRSRPRSRWRRWPPCRIRSPRSGAASPAGNWSRAASAADVDVAVDVGRVDDRPDARARRLHQRRLGLRTSETRSRRRSCQASRSCA